MLQPLGSHGSRWPPLDLSWKDQEVVAQIVFRGRAQGLVDHVPVVAYIMFDSLNTISLILATDLKQLLSLCQSATALLSSNGNYWYLFYTHTPQPTHPILYLVGVLFSKAFEPTQEIEEYEECSPSKIFLTFNQTLIIRAIPYN